MKLLLNHAMIKPTINTAPRNCEVTITCRKNKVFQQKYIIITQQITLMAIAQRYPLQQHSIVITAATPLIKLIFAAYSISVLILILLRSDYCLSMHKFTFTGRPAQKGLVG